MRRLRRIGDTWWDGEVMVAPTPPRPPRVDFLADLTARREEERYLIWAAERDRA